MRTASLALALALALQSAYSFSFPAVHSQRVCGVTGASSLPSFRCNAVGSSKTFLKSSKNWEFDHQASLTPKYWGDLARKNLDWFKDFSITTSGGFESGDVKWFEDGQLNACYNALDRHILAGKGDKVAIIYEADEAGDVTEMTYKQTLDRVSQIANMMKSEGVKKGDVVTVYMPMTPDVILTMLACARIGAVHSVVFAGFSEDAIADRIAAANSKFVFTTNVGLRGGKTIKLKQTVDNAIAKDRAKAIVEKVFLFKRTEEEVNFVEGRDIWADELLAKQSTTCEAEVMDAEDPLFILYTSGSTGSPKGILHTTGGYSLYAMHTTKTSFDLRDDDIYACVADAGWITGHTYICYGPLLNGATTTVFESTPLYPDEGRYWDMVERLKINVFYTAPTAIRSLMRFGDESPKKYDLSSLRVLGSVGEPINPAAWDWYHNVIGGGKATVVDTYWQTETGGHVACNLPGIHVAKAGSCRGGTYGIDMGILDAQTGEEQVGNDVDGVLVIKKPWPGMARTVLGDHERFMTTYLKPYPGNYFAGDGARRDEDGYIWVTGRTDDVINSSGHRIGSAEVESALVATDEVAQAAVVGFPHDIKGEGIACYVTLNNGVEMSDDMKKSLKMAVRSSIGPFATPDMIINAPALPMTRSGKIMRRILRKIAGGENEFGDTSTLADPSCVPVLVENARN
ncbi:hypothetical protein TrVE_jg3459 [Triparma verrucosa]|uniref:Acetyl-coenzyme A synthetase n=1 Tax=Triparma verrucosa TaxID=1606542 RepID=A0A9W7BP45_9STRA|nr:hypothetical protein TrVE_jg3459 [Triparma verrucosa]